MFDPLFCPSVFSFVVHNLKFVTVEKKSESLPEYGLLLFFGGGGGGGFRGKICFLR